MELKNKIGPITAIVVTGAAIIWMATGDNGLTSAPSQTNQSATTDTQVNTAKAESKPSYSVQAQTITARPIQLHLPLSGKTLANETLELRNTFQGRVVQLFADKGDTITEGRSILKIDTRVLASQIEEAKLILKQRTLEFEGIKKLSSSNYSTRVNLAQADANLATARANYQSLLIDLENANLTAPFTGVLNTLNAQKGAFLTNDASVGTLVSLDPIRVQVNIPQNKVTKIELGTLADITFESGKNAEGTVSYISTTANEASRTISVEMLVDNPDNKIPAGLSATVDFLLEDQKAQAFSPALLTLDDSGNTAVKVLDVDNIVTLMPVEIVKSERDKVWVTGLPDNVNIITVGQGFVAPGDKVNAHYQD